MPEVSVVMPVYNGERFLAAAIESILAQSFSDFELIIVDDGSQDGSAEIIRGFAERDPRIRMLLLEENTGVSHARNAGLGLAKGEFVTGMDQDDVSLPERLWKQVTFLRANSEIGVVGVHAHVVSEDMQPLYDRKPAQDHATILFDGYVGSLGASFVHASIMMRRTLVLEVGGYDESMHYCYDGDLMTRMRERTKFANIGEFLYIYRRHADQASAFITARHKQEILLVHKRRLERILSDAPIDMIDRLDRIRPSGRLSWRERRLAKRDLKRLIDAMIAARWIEVDDRPALIAIMNRRLEGVSPRLWQMFRHWYRYRIRRPLSEIRKRLQYDRSSCGDR